MHKTYTIKNSLVKCFAGLGKYLGLMFFFACFVFIANAQVCGTSGIDGPSTNANPVNTYYPIPLGQNVILPIGSKSILLDAVPPDDVNYGNSYGKIGIRAGDLILIIQMQDATINSNNSARYGSGSIFSGVDNLGGTGSTNIRNSGKFEYVIATNNVPLTGGNLTFRGGGIGDGTVNEYNNAAPTNTNGQRRFQIVRVPQYSNLVLTSNITTAPYNGRAGGVIAFDVAGDMTFGGYVIDATKRGFRGGYGPNIPVSDANNSSLYVASSASTASVGKGEGIAGTPRFMYDGFNMVDNGIEGLPNGSYGKGAPANAGGGGNDHNGGGGGGANGGSGGVGGNGWAGAGGTTPNGGRPGSAISQDLTRLIMGGGGGGGDANDATSGVKGGVGGGIILINVEKIVGAGIIMANGGAGERGEYSGAPDGAGGGGAGGTIFIRSLANSPGATLTIQANGGNGGNTVNDNGNEHGPGGGGGGGVIYHNVPAAVVNVTVNKGLSGKANDGAGISHNAADGRVGIIHKFDNIELPAHLQGGGQICYPELTTVLTEQNPGIPGSRNPGTTATYTLTITNSTTGGNAGGVQAELKLPAGFTITSITANLINGTTGAINPVFTPSAGIYSIGSTNLADAYNIPPGGQVSFTINVAIANNVAEGMHHASAQTTYLDPTRTSLNPNRRVTAKNNAFSGSNTAHETGNAGDVDGSNYNGDLAASTGEDVHINAKPRPDDLNIYVLECFDRAQGTLKANDPDAAHTATTLVYTLEGTYDTSKGTFTLGANGDFLFVPKIRFFGTVTIQFRVTDPLGAYDIGELTINQPQPLLNITETITHISAYGANDGAIAVVSSGGVGTRTYRWLYPDGSVVTTQNISNLAPGQYELTIKDENNCEYTEPYIVREPPSVTLLPSPSVCVGETTVILPYSNPRVNPTSYSIIWNSTALAAGLVNVTDAALPSIVAPATSANINIVVPANITVNTYNGILKVKNTAGDSSGDIPFSISITPYPLKAHIQLVQ